MQTRYIDLSDKLTANLIDLRKMSGNLFEKNEAAYLSLDERDLFKQWQSRKPDALKNSIWQLRKAVSEFNPAIPKDRGELSSRIQGALNLWTEAGSIDKAIRGTKHDGTPVFNSWIQDDFRKTLKQLETRVLDRLLELSYNEPFVFKNIISGYSEDENLIPKLDYHSVEKNIKIHAEDIDGICGKSIPKTSNELSEHILDSLNLLDRSIEIAGVAGHLKFDNNEARAVHKRFELLVQKDQQEAKIQDHLLELKEKNKKLFKEIISKHQNEGRLNNSLDLREIEKRTQAARISI
jgi:hypothetical protein